MSKGTLSMTANPFDVFGVVPAYAIDLKALDKQYYTLQSQHHPDRSSDAFTSSQINHAYQTLKHPVKRAEALLKILSFGGENNSITLDLDEDNDSTPSDAAIRLSDLLEFQEAIMMCEDVKDARTILSELDDKLTEAQHEFSHMFEQGQYEHLPDIYGKMCYFDRLKRQVIDVEETLFQRAPVTRYM